MAEESMQPSRDSLIAFLDFAGEKGLMKRATAGAYKKACNIILRILDEEEAADLSKVDLENVFFRHRNKAAGKIAPQTLKTYETRTRAAVSDFIEYIKDPSSWKPSVQPRTRRATKPTQPVAKPKSRTLSRKSESVMEPRETATQPSVHIDFQIHISPEATPEQINKIFASMREHLYPKQND
jgi:hypothetical protein